MSDNIIQTSFNAGEWAPDLNARVDLAKYHSGAALLRNFFVDYRGGATTRPGSRFVNRTFKSTATRLIRFQASFTVSYVLEFGDGYVRFYNNGAPVLETAQTITAVTLANPGVFTVAAHGYSNGDWVVGLSFPAGWPANGSTFIVQNVTANTFTLTDLFGVPLDTTTFPAWTTGPIQRIYTIASPYLANEVFGIRYAQDVNLLFLCHPNHPPFVLTLNSVTNWSLAAIVFGSTIASPAAPTITASGPVAAAGSVNYAYIVTSVDSNGQESAPSTPGTLASISDIRTAAGTINANWAAVPGAQSYNVYRAEPQYSASVFVGAGFGFVGNCTGHTFADSNITPDFSQPPPLVQNPFAGAGVQNITLTAGGSYTVFPTIGLTAPPGGGVQATAVVSTMQTLTVNLSSSGINYNPGDTVTMADGLIIVVTGVNAFLSITSFVVSAPGRASFGPLPTNPVPQISTSGFGSGASFNLTWFVAAVGITNPGTGYLVAPTATFTPAGATAITTLGAPSSGNPTVPGLHQQRSVFAGPVLSPAQFNMSQPGSIFNFNITDPPAADNAIAGTLVSGQLNTIQSMISMPTGLIMLSDKGAWLLNGGQAGQPITAISAVANPQAYNGASAIEPIVANYDILYVQSKNSIVRDLTYNFYTNIFAGTDISILSSHLFYGFQIVQWGWAEEPFKVVWAVRNDGIMLFLTFLKEQELIAWAHGDTQGLYTSVTTVTETATPIGAVDAVYAIAQRTVQGQTVQYIERFVELTYPADYKSSWQVDAGIGYNGVPVTTFRGAQHLGGLAVTGVADGVVINFTMPISGTFVFGGGGTAGLTGIANASIVTVGLAFTPQLQTLALDLGQPTVQGKRKKVDAVTTRVKNTLGLSAGRTFQTLTAMKDLVIGNVGTMSNALVNGLVTSDARTIVDPQWDVFGQYCFQQSNPYPSTILGVIPEINVGDTQK